jgi:hypothetical protein
MKRNKLWMLVGVLGGLGIAVPAEAAEGEGTAATGPAEATEAPEAPAAEEEDDGPSIVEIYIRGHGGFEYLDLTAIDYSGALSQGNLDYAALAQNQRDFLNNLTKEYKGEGYVVGGAAGLMLFNFLDLGVDFRQAGLTFDSGQSGDLTQITLNIAWHLLGTSLVVDPSIALGLGYTYLKTTIPVYPASFDPLNPVPTSTEERTFNGWIGRAGVAIDFRFVSWMSVGVTGDFSFLYFDAGAEKKSWGLNTDVMGRISFHI